MKLNLDEALKELDKIGISSSPGKTTEILKEAFRILCGKSSKKCEFGDLITDGQGIALFLYDIPSNMSHAIPSRAKCYVLILRKHYGVTTVETGLWLPEMIGKLGQNYGNGLRLIINGLQSAEISLKNKNG